jgi:hypothetical protein
MSHKDAPKFAFYYALSLVSLVFTSLSVGIVIFQIINKNITDIIDQYTGRFEPEALKFAISALIIAAPIYYFLQKLINKSLYSGELDKDSAVRRWLTYFILLVSSVVMIFWLIITLNSFLDGDLTTKFILKALTAIGISALIFSFYLYDIKREKVKKHKDQVITIFFYSSLTLVVAAFVFAIFNVESPAETRKRKLDEMTLGHFDQIVFALERYQTENNKLPESLDELSDDLNFRVENSTRDPETKEPYEYRVIADKKIELCAVFRLSNQDDQSYRNEYLRNRWPHDAGRTCFEQDIKDNQNQKELPENRPQPVR